MENLTEFQRLYLPPSSGGIGERVNLSQMGPLESAGISTLNWDSIAPYSIMSENWG